ncbi:MAG: winged helix-turn-helix domain-containing protein, partial [Muribaculaceae bacterium]|nr:winged helix-turn-helix domain-containing protein [Muribaculaceae bacterium]
TQKTYKHPLKNSGQQTGQKTNQQAGQETNQQTGQKTGQQTGQHLSKETEISRQLKFICLLMKENPEITYKQLQSTVGIKKTTLTDRINLLKSEGRIIRKGGTFGGQWIVID